MQSMPDTLLHQLATALKCNKDMLEMICNSVLYAQGKLTLIKLPTAFVISMKVFVLPDAAANGATAAKHRMFLTAALI